MNPGQLAKYGPTGIAIALVVALTVVIQGVFSMVGNHMAEYGESIRIQAKSTQELTDVMRASIARQEKNFEDILFIIRSK